MNGNRLRVDLQEFYSDERARCWLWVRYRDKARRLRWLAASIQRRWKLPGRVALTLDGRLLHPRDPVALLSTFDTLRVIPFTKNWFDDESDTNNSTEEEPEATEWKEEPPPEKEAVSRQSHVDEADSLQREKRHALQLLDACTMQWQGQGVGGEDEGEQMECGDGDGAAQRRTRRRRVRRRRRASPPAPPTAPDAPRAPRLVRALEPEPSLVQMNGGTEVK